MVGLKEYARHLDPKLSELLVIRLGKVAIRLVREKRYPVFFLSKFVLSELDRTFATRWAVESRFPTATKRICCVGTATSHCLSRLVNEVSKLTARVQAVNGLVGVRAQLVQQRDTPRNNIVFQLEDGGKGDGLQEPTSAVTSESHNPFDEDCDNESMVEDGVVEERLSTRSIGS